MSALDDLRAKVAEAKPTKQGSKKVWIQPEVDDFRSGSVLAFDQTLTKTGWSVVVVRRPDGFPVEIIAGGVLQPGRPVAKGFEETFAKAEAMEQELTEVIGMWGHSVDAIVHEMPSVAGYRIESSLMAAREIRRVARRTLVSEKIVMLSRTSAYAALTGSAYAEKARMTEAVNRLVPNYCRNTTRWTQDVHDSVGLGLKYLHYPKDAE